MISSRTAFRWIVNGLLPATAICVLAWFFWPAASDPSHTQVAQKMQSMQSYCLGRFFVSLPADVRVVVSTSGVEAGFSFKGKMTRHAFNKLVEERWQELQQKTHDLFGNPYIAPSSIQRPAKLASRGRSALDSGPSVPLIHLASAQELP